MTQPWSDDLLAIKGYRWVNGGYVKEQEVKGKGSTEGRAPNQRVVVTTDGKRIKHGTGNHNPNRDAQQVSRPAPSPTSPYDSKLEAAYAQFLQLEQRAGNIAGWLHHPFTFRLSSGKRYTVDFIAWGYDGSTYCIEVKGWHVNRRDSLTHLHWAAQRFPFHRWLLVTRNKQGGWDEQHIKP